MGAYKIAAGGMACWNWIPTWLKWFGLTLIKHRILLIKYRLREFFILLQNPLKVATNLL